MPKIVDKPKRRREIALRAMKLFSEKGFDKTSVREISEACGMSKGSLYDYFTDKDDVLAEVVSASLQAWRDHVQDLRSSECLPDDRIRELLIRTVHRMSDQGISLLAFMGIVRREPKRFASHPLVRSVEALSKETQDAVARWLEEGKVRGIFKPSVDPSVDAANLMGALDGLFLRHRYGLEPRNLRAGLERLLDVFLDGLAS